jgi:hypothetical protein
MVNSGIAKMCGQPKNLSANTGGRTTTVGAGTNGNNSTIAGNHFLEACDKYGVQGVTEGMVKGG